MLCSISVSNASADLMDAQVAERQAKAAELTLRELDCPINIRTEYQNTFSTGSGIALWAIFSKDEDEIDVENPVLIGSDVLGERGKKAEIVGEEAAKRLIDEIESGAAVDSHLADNLIPFLALFSGEIRTSRITEHVKSNIYACEQFLGKIFKIEENNISIVE